MTSNRFGAARIRFAAMAFLVLLLGACANPGGTLQQAGTADVFDMQITTDLNWSRIKSWHQEVWTIDGVALNSLSIFSGVKPGEHVFMKTREKTSRPDGPWFRAGMRPEEIRDITVDALREQQWVNVSSDNLRPQRFGTLDGLRFDLVMTSPNGLIYKGTVAAVEKDGKLTLLFWKAPAEYYYGRDFAAVAKMLDNIKFVASTK